jgi:hypothetical protein
MPNSQRAEDKVASKLRIATAKILAKAHGLDVLGWNDKPGREFISVNGSSDARQALQAELEGEGWHAWPQELDEDNSTMDFSLYPAPSKPAPGDGGITAEPDPTQLPYVGGSFIYRGPGGLFYRNFFLLAVIVGVVPWVNSHLTNLQIPLRLMLSVGGIILAALLLLPAFWVEMSGDRDKLIIRKHFFGARRIILFRDVKRSVLHREKDLRGYSIEFLGITLASGKTLDLYLPKAKRLELLAFIRNGRKSEHN